jgi:RES domain-containing protein
MRIYRISHRDFLPQSSGGALRRSGRWHVKGTSVLYASVSLALAVLELKANDIPFARLREVYHFAEADISGLPQEVVPESFYDDDWHRDIESSRNFGRQWVNASRASILRVRSTALPVEWNCVLNTGHPDFSKVVFSEPRMIPLDDRL